MRVGGKIGRAKIRIINGPARDQNTASPDRALFVRKNRAGELLLSITLHENPRTHNQPPIPPFHRMVGHIGVLDQLLGNLRLLDGTGEFRLSECSGGCESPAARTYHGCTGKLNQVLRRHA